MDKCVHFAAEPRNVVCMSEFVAMPYRASASDPRFIDEQRVQATLGPDSRLPATIGTVTQTDRAETVDVYLLEQA